MQRGALAAGRRLPEQVELGLDRTTQTVAVLRLEALECIDVGVERVARALQAGDLGFELRTLALRHPGRVRLGLRDERLGALLRVADHLLCLRARLGDRLVRGLLREHERALDDVGVGGADRRRGRHRGDHRCRRRDRDRRGSRSRWSADLRPAAKLLRLGLEVLDRCRGPLEELVDVVAVIPAPCLADLDVSELLRGHIHGSHGGQC